MTPQGRYTILGEIASGGTATVFLAEDIVLRRKVALKKLHPHLLNHPEMVKRFEKEAVAVASLSHENVVKIFDFGREDKSVFLAMEYVDGSSLDSILKGSDGRIPNLAALCLFHQLLAGLAAAHACGIFHRDIKPSNVLVDRKGCVRIADFGIAFLSEDTSITRTGAYLGTPGYSAPEQAVGRPVTAKTDIYATGTLFYRCLTGRLPFAGETPHAVLMAIVEKTQVKANLVNPRILPGLADLVQDMLAKSPAKRPDALECARRLEKIAVDAGFPLDPARLCRMTAGASAYAEKERKELAARFVEQARLMETQGKTREAMKRYSLAEIFTEKNDEQAREAGRHLRMGTATSLRRGAAALAAIALLAFGIRLAVKTSREAEPDAPKAGKELTAAVSAPATAAESLELPSLVPEWPEGDARTGIGNGTFSDATAGDLVPKGGGPASAASGEAMIDRAAFARSGEGPHPSSQGPSRGYFKVMTNPPFARVLVDGKELGTTPMPSEIALPEGAHLLEVLRAGCKPVQKEIQISEWDTTFLRITLDRLE